MVGESPLENDGLACTDAVCDSETGVVSQVPHDQLCEAQGLCGEGVCDLEQGCITVTVPDCCGNGITETDEECDDGNAEDGDGCTTSCTSENTVVTLGPNIQITPNLAHASMTRFDDHHSATIYASQESPDVAPTFYRIVIHKRVGKELTWVNDWYFDQDQIGSVSVQAFELFAAVGPNHLIAVLITPEYGRTFNTYKWDGADSLELLSSEPMNQDKGFLGGHPVDTTRFILRYRYQNSGEPVTYQVVSRTGDSFSFGPEMIRPGPEMFPGLSSNISQAEPILMRTGPTTFREIRPGYVWDPGYLASYMLEVNGNELSWSSPVVHTNSGNRTMEPLVASDGAGGGAVAYVTYDESMFQWAHYSAGSDQLGFEGPLLASQTQYNQGVFESSDGYVGGAYYLREHSGNLFKISEGANGVWDAVSVDSDLTYQGCYRAPHIVRLGTIGLFLRCTAGGETAYLRVVDLHATCGDGVTDAGEACDDGNNESGDGCSSTCTL
jgi:cysteine-rich repeat protein